MTGRSPIAVVERGYNLGVAEDDAWLRAVLGAARPLLDDGLGVAAFGFSLTGNRPVVGKAIIEGALAEFPDAVDAAHRAAPESALRRSYFDPSTRVATMSEMVTGGAAFTEFAPFANVDVPGALKDALIVRATDPSGIGCVLCGPRREMQSVSHSDRRRWTLVAAHIAAALRLRKGIQSEAARVEAWVSPGGRVEHAEGAARAARTTLRDAVATVERARSRRGSQSVDRALGAWQSLVSGRWSLVDRFESDGRRYVVAMVNPPDVVDPRGLAPREREIAAYLEMGHSNKLVGYELGLAEGTVAAHVAEIKRKLGVHTRTGLVERLTELRSARWVHTTVADSAVSMLVTDKPNRVFAGLTPAERDVAQRAVAGASNADIAQARRCSVRTVENLMAAALRKVGARSRAELAVIASRPDP